MKQGDKFVLDSMTLKTVSAALWETRRRIYAEIKTQAPTLESNDFLRGFTRAFEVITDTVNKLAEIAHEDAPDEP